MMDADAVRVWPNQMAIEKAGERQMYTCDIMIVMYVYILQDLNKYIYILMFVFELQYKLPVREPIPIWMFL